MSIFIDNKYTRWYYKIVTNAQSRSTIGYVEKHHIIPRALNGNNNKDNLVVLTAREHYICHWLLIKMTDGANYHKMASAFWRMVNTKNTNRVGHVKIPSRVYEIAKSHAAIASSNRNKGTKRTSEVRQQMSEKRTGKGNAMYGRKHSDETIQKIREKRALQDNSHLKGRIINDEWREKIRQTLNGKTKGITKPKEQCTVCGGMFAKHIISRYHNSENCKNH